MRLLLPSVTFAQERAAVAEAERVIVTGSNIPTADEVGPNPVDTYRLTDIEKLGWDRLLTRTLPMEVMAASYRTCGVCFRKKLWCSSMENALP
jgi:hypothetical protein